MVCFLVLKDTIKKNFILLNRVIPFRYLDWLSVALYLSATQAGGGGCNTDVLSLLGVLLGLLGVGVGPPCPWAPADTEG